MARFPSALIGMMGTRTTALQRNKQGSSVPDYGKN
jgi:hypothetical protein